MADTRQVFSFAGGYVGEEMSSGSSAQPSMDTLFFDSENLLVAFAIDNKLNTGGSHPLQPYPLSSNLFWGKVLWKNLLKFDLR